MTDKVRLGNLGGVEIQPESEQGKCSHRKRAQHLFCFLHQPFGPLAPSAARSLLPTLPAALQALLPRCLSRQLHSQELLAQSGQLVPEIGESGKPGDTARAGEGRRAGRARLLQAASRSSSRGIAAPCGGTRREHAAIYCSLRCNCRLLYRLATIIFCYLLKELA